MEHKRFDYSPIASRPVFSMPNGARVAIWIVPNVEHFHWGKPAISMTGMTAALNPDVLNYAWRDYGARVGIWRLMEILDRTGFPATAGLNSEVCEQYPDIVREGTRLGWEWLAHGANNSSLFTGMDKETEHAVIGRVLDTIEKSTGRRSRGWLGPALTETDNTLDILHDLKIDYVADWCNDELPYAIKTNGGSILSVPYTLELGDIPIFLEHGGNGEDFYNAVKDQFDVLYEEGKVRPRVMALALHPFIIGHPFRAKHLERALRYIAGHELVWKATGSEIADWYRAAVDRNGAHHSL
jgi:allantoinase